MWTAGDDTSGAEHGGRIAMLQRVIAELHLCTAKHLETVHVVEAFGGKTIWEGDVEVFAVSDSGIRARRCYAWTRRRGRRRGLQMFAVMETSIIKTALDAVKCAHVASSQPLVDEFTRLSPDRERAPPD